MREQWRARPCSCRNMMKRPRNRRLAGIKTAFLGMNRFERTCGLALG